MRPEHWIETPLDTKTDNITCEFPEEIVPNYQSGAYKMSHCSRPLPEYSSDSQDQTSTPAYFQSSFIHGPEDQGPKRSLHWISFENLKLGISRTESIVHSSLFKLEPTPQRSFSHDRSLLIYVFPSWKPSSLSQTPLALSDIHVTAPMWSPSEYLPPAHLSHPQGGVSNPCLCHYCCSQRQTSIYLLPPNLCPLFALQLNGTFENKN